MLGWPLEWTEIIVIFMPIFLPLLKTFDVDPLFFGLLVALNIQTSFLSPRWRWRRSISRAWRRNGSTSTISSAA